MDPISLCDKCRNEFTLDAVAALPLVSTDVLRANQLPLRTESEQTLLHLEMEEHELKRCDQEIGRLQEKVEQMSKYRRILSERIERRRSWLSPIRRLPVEILEEIFALVCLSGSGYSLDISAGQSKPDIAPTLNLSQVSQHWRRIVNSSPRLWSTIRIEASTKIDVVYLLEFYLINSQSYLLDFDFTAVIPRTAGRDTFFVACTSMMIILGHSHRLEKLHLNMNWDIFEYTNFRTLPSFPCLCSFSNISSFPSFGANGLFWAALYTAPRLTKVMTDTILPPTTLPYHRLTVLVLPETFDCIGLFAILRLCTGLESLHVCEYSISTSADEEVPINMGSLRHLSVSTHDNDISDFFEWLTLPQLVSLEISIIHIDPASLIPLRELLRRSDCPLTDLTLKIPYISHASTAELHELFELCPGLCRLVVNTRGDNDGRETFTYQLFDALRASTSDSQGILVPNLARLKVTEDGAIIDPDTAVALRKMVESRNARRTDNKTIVWDFDVEFGELCPEDPGQGVYRFQQLVGKEISCNIRWIDFKHSTENVVDG